MHYITKYVNMRTRVKDLNIYVIQLDLWMFQKSINRINNVTLCTSISLSLSLSLSVCYAITLPLFKILKL